MRTGALVLSLVVSSPTDSVRSVYGPSLQLSSLWEKVEHASFFYLSLIHIKVYSITGIFMLRRPCVSIANNYVLLYVCMRHIGLLYMYNYIFAGICMIVCRTKNECMAV